MSNILRLGNVFAITGLFYNNLISVEIDTL